MDVTPENEKVEFVQRARMAEQIDRYDDMRDFMKKATEFGVGLSPMERNLLSTAYKYIVGHHRSSWRIVSTIERKSKDINESMKKLVKEYRETIESELLQTCNDILKLVDTYLLPNAPDTESKVFYMKMKGDYYRYLAEFVIGEDRDIVVENSQRSYEEAYNIAKEKLSPIHTIRLGIALNFSVFYYEILGEVETACKLAKEAFEVALPETHDASVDEHGESALVIQLLRDNWTLWTSDPSGEHEETGAEVEDDTGVGMSRRH